MDETSGPCFLSETPQKGAKITLLSVGRCPQSTGHTFDTVSLLGSLVVYVFAGSYQGSGSPQGPLGWSFGIRCWTFRP